MSYPFAKTWWIEKDKILGGRYPGSPDPAEQRQMLAALLDHGVRLFVNLQHPDDRGVGGKPFPDYTNLAKQLAKQGGLKVEVCRFPVQDVSVPSPQIMQSILDRLDQAVAAGQMGYVHCYGGHGRTGTVAGCWMVHNGMPGPQALKAIRLARRHDAHLVKMPSPETDQQRQFVLDWHQHERQTAQPKAEPTASPAVKDRALGALLGLAVGDAVGTALEFEAPGAFEPLTDMVGGGPFHLRPGQWTDDTSLALCLADSLVQCKGFDPRDQMERYCRWWKDGLWSSTGDCFDIGNTTSAALDRFLTTGEPYAGSANARAAGNGALMRLAPVPIAYAASPRAAVAMAGESSRTTHGAKESIDACRYLAGMLLGLIAGATKEQVLGPMYCPVDGLWDSEPLAPKVLAIAKGSFKTKQPPDIRGTGYVVACLEAALWAFASTDSFRDAILAAANLGEDADTTAAVCGQLAGACYGRSGIPKPWIEKLAMRKEIESLVRKLFELKLKAGKE